MKSKYKTSWKMESVQRCLNEKEGTGLLSKEETEVVSLLSDSQRHCDNQNNAPQRYPHPEM